MTGDALVDWDVLVAGGGPAGAATALALAELGRSVVVCEKSTFPREKACGDGLTPRAVQGLIDLGLGAEVSRWPPVRGVRAHGRGRTRTFEFPAGGSWPATGVVVPRSELDQLVLDRAAGAGATVWTGTEVVDVVWSEGRVRAAVVRGEGGTREIGCRWLVCADGAGGPVARRLGISPGRGFQRALAMRQYFPLEPVDGAWFDVFLDVRVGGRIMPGYGWVFPVGDGTVNAGVGFTTASARWRGSNLHHLMRAFEARLPPEWGIGPATAAAPPRAGRLPMGGAVGPVRGPGFVAVGDAAAWVNPATGEGIAYAYETGMAAARHLDGALADGTSATLATYEQELRTSYGPYFQVGRVVNRALGDPRAAEAMVAACLATRVGFGFTMTMFTHLEEPTRAPTQVGMRTLQRLARPWA